MPSQDGGEGCGGGSSSNSAIDMNDVARALALMKAEMSTAASPANSVNSGRTSAATPEAEESPARFSAPAGGSAGPGPSRARPTDSSDSSSDSEIESSISVGSRTSSKRGSGGLRRIACVRWRDEEGGELVSAIQTTDYWEEMVFGPSGGGEGDGDGCAAASPPSELYMFLAELTRGVEATVIFPTVGGMSKKRRRVVLFTDDNGASISWLKQSRSSSSSGGGGAGNHGGGGGVRGSCTEYRIRSETLLEVKDRSGAGRPPAPGGSEAEGWAEEQQAVGCDIGLKWRPQPTWPKRSVRVVDVQTESQAIFCRGMQQLLSFNTDLQPPGHHGSGENSGHTKGGVFGLKARTGGV